MFFPWYFPAHEIPILNGVGCWEKKGPCAGKQCPSKVKCRAPLCVTAGRTRMVNTGLPGQNDWIQGYAPPPLVSIQSPTSFTAVIISNTGHSLGRAGNWAEISLHPGHKRCIYHREAQANVRHGCVCLDSDPLIITNPNFDFWLIFFNHQILYTLNIFFFPERSQFLTI